MPKKRSDIAVSFHVQPRLLAGLDVAAEVKGISRSEVIRLAVLQYLINEGIHPSNRKENE